MNIEELIKRCRLTDDERKRFSEEARRRANELAALTEGDIDEGDIDGIYDGAELAMLDAQIRKAIPIIAEYIKRKEVKQ